MHVFFTPFSALTLLVGQPQGSQSGKKTCFYRAGV